MDTNQKTVTIWDELAKKQRDAAEQARQFRTQARKKNRSGNRL